MRLTDNEILNLTKIQDKCYSKLSKYNFLSIDK